jgi:serine/threonine protein kinase
MATVSPIADKEAFLAILHKSGLLSADVLSKAREGVSAADDARAAARQLVKTGLLTKWQAGQLLHGYHVLTIGKYKLLDQLASGETGRIYLAEHAQMERRHALKILSRRHASQPEVLKRFLSDAERLCQLEHRNLSHIYDVNQDGERYYVVMEHIEGQDLRRRVEQQGPLAAAEALGWIRQAAAGLAHAHQRQVFHGDLKPANLVIDAAGNLKITDIGQARLVAAPPTSADETSEAAALASAIYRAPELRAGSQTVDARSDVYSLGAVLCFLLSGKAEPDATSARQTLEAKGQAAELIAVTTRMMADDPAARFASMEEVSPALGGLPATQATGEKAAAPPLKKTKKPLVARPIPEVSPAAGPGVPSATAPENKPAAADPFVGFTVQPSPRGKGGPVAKAGLPAAAVSPASKPAAADSPALAKKSRLPLILGAAIGGSLLVLAGIAVIVVLAINWAGDAASHVVADANDAIDKAAANVAPPDGGAESNPESNPELNPKPAVAPSSVTPPVANPVNPLTPPTATIAPPMPAPVARAPMPQPMPVPMPAPAPGEPAPMPAPTETKPEPEKPAAPSNPFAGFATSATLPKLAPSATAEPPADALAPLALGPCIVDEKALVIIQLKGGDGAIRGGKQKFEIAAGQGGTALRDWEISLAGGTANVVVALLSVKENQLMFQWTPDGAKQASAPLLCNCGLHLSAGSGQHDVALRTPIKGEPLVVGLEKGGSAVKWEIDLLPDPNKVFLEISKLEGGFLKQKFKERQTLEGSDKTEIWTGSDETAMPLGLRITSTVKTQSIEVECSPQYQVRGVTRQPKALVKKELGVLEKQFDQARFVVNKKIEAASKAKGEAAERQANLGKVELDKVNQADDQLKELKSLIENLDGKGEIHFRVYYQTEDGPIDLLVTGEAPPKDDAK